MNTFKAIVTLARRPNAKDRNTYQNSVSLRCIDTEFTLSSKQLKQAISIII